MRAFVDPPYRLMMTDDVKDETLVRYSAVWDQFVWEGDTDVIYRMMNTLREFQNVKPIVTIFVPSNMTHEKGKGWRIKK